MRRIVLFAYPGVQLLDVAGPAAVFGAAPGHAVTVVSARGGAVATSCGVALATEAPRGGPVDTVLMPGGDEDALRASIADTALSDAMETARGRARRWGSVCSGAVILAAWGMLDGRRAATHWQAVPELRRFDRVTVDGDALFVTDGEVWTSAGVSTGIDMALAMVEADCGAATAAAIARRFVLQQRRPGHQSQFSPMLRVQEGRYRALGEWIGANLTDDLSLPALAARAGEAPRSFHRHFLAETGFTPAAFVERLRLDRARLLLEAGRPAKAVAAEAGFGALDRMGRAFQRAFGLSPSAYATLHGNRASCGAAPAAA